MIGRVVAALVVAATMILLPAAPAAAHATLTGSNPAAGTVVPSAPKQVTLTFSEPVNVSLGRVTVLAPDGKQVHKGAPARRAGGREIVTTLAGGLARGTYVVSYRVVSADGHPISGGVVFSVGAPSRRGATADPSGAADIQPAVRAVYSGTKYAGYIGLALLVGALLVLLALWPRRLTPAGPRWLAWIGWGVLFTATAVSILAQVPYGTGGGLTDISWDGLVSTATGGVGAAQLVRLALLLAAVPLILRVTGGRQLGRVDTAALWSLFGGALLTWPLSGHAAASPGRLLTIPADALHVGAMAVWLGGLVVLSRFLLPAVRAREAALILPVWSRWALYAVVTLTITGAMQAMVEVGTLGAFTSTQYGRLVVAKAVGLALIGAVAIFSRRWVQRRFAGEPAVDGDEPELAADLAGAQLFRRGVVVELALGAALLAVASGLVQSVPSRAVTTSTAQEATATGTAFSTVVEDPKLHIQIQLDPAAVGSNSMHLYAFTPSGAPQQVLEWTASAALPDSGVEKLDIPLLPITPNHAVGEVQLPRAGEWTFRFTARLSDIDEVTVTRTIVLR